MKKILSLVLAALMICSLTVSASAAGKVYNISDLIDFYKYYTSDYNPYEDLGDYLASTGGIYQTWFDTCPKCGGLALFRVDDGLFKYTCMESKCSASGSYDPIPDKDDDKDDDKDKYDGFFTVKCSECDRTAYLNNKITVGSGVYYEYLCAKDHETVVKAENVKVDWDDVQLKPITCSRCYRYAEFDSYYTYGDDLYAVYACASGHKTSKVLDDNIFDWIVDESYRIEVRVNGKGNYSILGGSTAHYGEYKTISFTPEKGYMLAGVTVNGVAASVSGNKITVTVTDDMIVRATFVKIDEDVTLTTTVNGAGSIKAAVGSKTVNAAKTTIAYGGKITYTLTPDYDNYKVTSIKINGQSAAIPASGKLVLSNVTEDTKIEISFGWKNPYCDVSDKYLKSVEYVTEAGVMTAVSANGNKLYFKGSNKITEKDFAAVLAELADTEDKLDTTGERIAWAVKYGIVSDEDDLSVICTVQAAADMVNVYLAALEELNDIEFDKFDDDDTAKENALSIGLVSANAYKNNRQLCRYDLASVARLIANLEYND